MDQPYFNIAGELLADTIVLTQLVNEHRPASATIGGSIVVTIHGQTGEILVGRQLADGTIVVVERVLADPAHPATFGASELPIVVPDDARAH